MIETVGAQTLRVAFGPERAHARLALHAFAMATGMLIAARMGTEGLPLTYVAWYCVTFVAFHVVLVPVLAAWWTAQRSFEGWIRSLVEQELIRFDLQTYDKQLKRLLATTKEARRDGDRHE
jgi:hypothetical protein